MKNILVIVTAVLLWVGPVRPAQADRGGRLEGVVNLNTATADELQLLPFVGPAKAQAIIAYRQSRPFRTVEELGRIKGIGRRTIKRLRPHLTVSGPTTAKRVAATAVAVPCPADAPGPIRTER